MSLNTTTTANDTHPTTNTQWVEAILHTTTQYLEENGLLVHDTKSATLTTGNLPPPSLRPSGPPLQPAATLTYLGAQQAARPDQVTLPPKLQHQLAKVVILARILTLSTQALAYFLQAVLNAAIGFQPLHLTQPQHMLQEASNTVCRVWTIHSHMPTSFPGLVRRAMAPYYGDNTDHLVEEAYTAHTAAHLHRFAHNHQPEVRETLTILLRDTQRSRNTCPQYVLQQEGMPTSICTRFWNHFQLLLPDHNHAILTNHGCRESGTIAILNTDVGGGPCGESTILTMVGVNIHTVRVSQAQMNAVQQAGTQHVPFLQHPEWPHKAVLEAHLRQAARAADRPQPTTELIAHAFKLFSATHPHPVPISPPRHNTAIHHPPQPVQYVPGPTVLGALLLAPNGLKVTNQRTRIHNIPWLTPPPTAKPFIPPDLPTDPHTGIPTRCWKCGPHAPATPWPILQLIAHQQASPTAHATTDQYPWLYTLFDRANPQDTTTITWDPKAPTSWYVHQGTHPTHNPAFTFPVTSNHRNPAQEAPATPTSHKCSRDTSPQQTLELATRETLCSLTIMMVC